MDFPILKIDRCEFIEIDDKYAPSLLQLLGDKRVSDYLEGVDTFNSLEDANSFISLFQQAFEYGDAILWGIKDSRESSIIGIIGVCDLKAVPILFYALLPSYWGKGIMTECVLAVTDYLHKILNKNSIKTSVLACNVASKKVMARCDYRFDEYNGCYFHNRWFNAYRSLEHLKS